MYEKQAAKNDSGSNAELAVSINLAGKQRMLTQKMSKELLLVALGHNTKENALNLLDSIDLFDRTLLGLQNGDDTLKLVKVEDKNIADKLEEISVLWQPFKAEIRLRQTETPQAQKRFIRLPQPIFLY